MGSLLSTTNTNRCLCAWTVIFIFYFLNAIQLILRVRRHSRLYSSAHTRKPIRALNERAFQKSFHCRPPHSQPRSFQHPNLVFDELSCRANPNQPSTRVCHVLKSLAFLRPLQFHDAFLRWLCCRNYLSLYSP